MTGADKNMFVTILSYLTVLFTGDANKSYRYIVEILFYHFMRFESVESIEIIERDTWIYSISNRFYSNNGEIHHSKGGIKAHRK